MKVSDCTPGVEYVVLCNPMVYLGRCKFTTGWNTVILDKDEQVYQVHNMMGKRWVLWHEALGSEVATYPFNNDIWVKVEDLR